jgi:hypothetical protein
MSGDDGGKFTIEYGWLKLAQTIDVDTEPAHYTISVQVFDRNIPPLDANVTILVYVIGSDDNIPEWAMPENGTYVASKYGIVCNLLFFQF